MNERVARLRLMLGDEVLERLEGATVMVLGLGGVGSACAEALARGGVGSLILLDRDTVEESNINRQAVAYMSTLGRIKAEVMEEKVADINPDCRVFAEQIYLTKENIDEALGRFPRPDYVIDCIDTVSQKIQIVRWCADNQIPLLASMGAANKLDPTYLQFAKIKNTKNCPLSKVIRRVCRQRGIFGLEVLFSSQDPVIIADRGSGTKAETLGSMSYMPPIMGQMLAGKVIRRLAGLEPIPRPPHLGKEKTPA